MNAQEKQFALDLLRALDVGMGDPLRTEEAYQADLHSACRTEIKKAVQYLIAHGYQKVSCCNKPNFIPFDNDQQCTNCGHIGRKQ
jgi:hypothetical protein